MRKVLGLVRGVPQKLRTYWKRVFRSKNENMSRGAQNIDRTIRWARGDNWRRKNPKK